MRRCGYSRPLFDGDETADDAIALERFELAEIVVEDDHRARAKRASLISTLEPGDVLVVTSLDRLDGKLDGLIRVLDELRERNIDVESGERSVFRAADDPLAGLLHELVTFQGRVRSRATREGMREGSRPGRPASLSDDDVAIARELRRFDRSIGHIARVLGVSASAVQRALARPSDEPG